MTWLERLRRKLRGPALPADTRVVFESAASPRDVLDGLDDLITRNEVALDALQKEIRRLEELERAETDAISGGEVGGRSRKNALRKVQRLRRQMDAMEERVRIHDANIALHLKLIGKIQAMEAMEMRGVKESEIDSVIVEFDAQLDEYRRTLAAGDLIPVAAAFEEAEDRDLEALEREILGGAPAAEPAGGAERVAGTESGTEAERAGEARPERPRREAKEDAAEGA